MKKNSKIIFVSVIIIIILTISLKSYALEKYTIYKTEKRNITSLTEAKNSNNNPIILEEKDNKIEEINSDIKIPDKEIPEKIIPETAYLESQFICQAPLETEANWIFHEESCEEAALLQAYLYEGNQIMTKDQANEEILDMIKWQKENFGGHNDIYADELKILANKYYGIPLDNIVITYDATLEDIKKEISNGHVVIAPVTSKFLKNPYYVYPGYHMLEVIGYTQNTIITNDNGTRRGADFSYPTEDFMKALNDSGADIITLHL